MTGAESARRQHSFYLDDRRYEVFKETANRVKSKSVSQAIEEAMDDYIMKHQEEANMKIVRQVPELKTSHAQVGSRLEVRMAKERLESVITSIEKIIKKEAHGDIKFLMDSLRKALKKAIPIQRKTQDSEMEKLFERAEKLLFEKPER